MKYTVLESGKEQNTKDVIEQFALDILMGLTSKKKFLSSKYFYDDKGSQIFSKIMDSIDYYPTDCEFEIFHNKKSHITKSIRETLKQTHDDFNVVELGAGDGRKTKILLEEIIQNKIAFNYFPIDISAEALDMLGNTFKKDIPALHMHGVVGEYQDSLKWIQENKSGHNLVMFLGSNIGNFNFTEAMVFLRTLWQYLNEGDLVLIGFDLKKDIDIMLRAYNDSAGYTAQFNLNLLNRINQELGANFDLKKFQHFGTYNPQLGSMESFLISLETQEVYVDYLKKAFHFKAYEPIHLEYSYKYLLSEVEFLAKESGFEVIENFKDTKGWFTDCLWKVIKD